ncbi:MAG: SMC-Scp complex subunit ScpB [Planctomycetota bacterium]|jgi:segregation and condensation protein B
MIQRPEADVPEQRAQLAAQIEALLFVSREPLPQGRLAELVDVEPAAVREALQLLQERYAGDTSGIHLVEIAGGWRLLTNPEFADTVAQLASRKGRDRLSPAALETLAIVAYKQPASRAEIERIRGVVKVAGREEGLGRALLYATTRTFLDRFGLKSPKDLPASLEL